MYIPVKPGKRYLDYQLKGINYALGARGTILADEMGLGKTIQAIGVLNYYGEQRAMRVLIVCPAGLKTNWRSELDEWLTEKAERHDVTIVSYNTADTLDYSQPWDILIVDEAHYIKNADSLRAKAVIRLAVNTIKHVILITGTPIENKPLEIWTLLCIACPEKWNPIRQVRPYVISPTKKASHPGEGAGFWEFAEKYCDLKRVVYNKGKNRYSRWDFSGASNLVELQQRLRATCMVRRHKVDVLDQLPPKRRKLVVLESRGNDDDMFPELCENNYFDVLKKLTADKVAFSEFSKRRHEQALAKLDDCIVYIENALDETDKIIVFAHHRDVIAKLAYAFDVTGIENVVVHGETHPADRMARVKRFQEDPAIKVFIGSIGAAGVGITLTAASRVVFVELDPVPGKMTQAEDRAHRIGQRDSVLIEHLVSDKSLCARMAKILVRKQAVLSAALDSVGAELVFRESSEKKGLP